MVTADFANALRFRLASGDGHATQYRLTALHIAARHNQADCVRLLLDKGANIDARCDVRCVELNSSRTF
jgi:hypothetical protein